MNKHSVSAFIATLGIIGVAMGLLIDLSVITMNGISLGIAGVALIVIPGILVNNASSPEDRSDVRARHIGCTTGSIITGIAIVFYGCIQEHLGRTVVESLTRFLFGA